MFFIIAKRVMRIKKSNAEFNISVGMSLGTVRLRQTRLVSSDLRFDLHWCCSTQGVACLE